MVLCHNGVQMQQAVRMSDSATCLLGTVCRAGVLYADNEACTCTKQAVHSVLFLLHAAVRVLIGSIMCCISTAAMPSST